MATVSSSKSVAQAASQAAVRRALDAAAAVAAEQRLAHHRLVVLKDAMNTVIRFEPLPLVARVCRWEDTAAMRAKLEKEVAVARHLASAAAPVIAPCAEPLAGPYYLDGVGLSLWPFVDHRPADEDRDAREAATTLGRVHAALASFPGKLPTFLDEIEDYAALRQAPGAFPGLQPAEKAFVLREHDRARNELAQFDYDNTPIHGDAHLGNLLMTPGGALWSDFEAACTGPIEWDLACLPVAALPLYGRWNEALERVLRRLRRLSIIMWSSASGEPSTEQRQAIAFHLARLQAR
jgi:hypothetical protein